MQFFYCADSAPRPTILRSNYQTSFLNTTLATFLITVGITAPALLDANIETDGKKLRPHQQTFQVDGTRITLDVDRALVTTGDKVTATIVAYSDTPKPVALDLRLVQTHLQLGERIEPPQHQIDREKITVQATPDGILIAFTDNSEDLLFDLSSSELK